MLQNKNKIIHHVICLDESGSMSTYTKQVQEKLNNVVKNWKESGEDARITLVTFGDRAQLKFAGVPAKNLTLDSYAAIGGSTALYDGVKVASEILKTLQVNSKNEVILFTVFTDGQENSSKTCSRHQFASIVTALNNEPNVTVTFEAPFGNKGYFQGLVPDGCILEWENTQEGFRRMRGVAGQSLSNYVADVKRGVTKSTNYYSVTTDLSQVQALPSTGLQNVTSEYKTYKVEKECDIASFFQVKTGNPYKKGSCWYQLTKSEQIQPTKSVLLMEKGKKDIYGGPQARPMIGLVDNTKIARVKPGNHSNYDIFVESQSDNRKLVRGTTLIVRK